MALFITNTQIPTINRLLDRAKEALAVAKVALSPRKPDGEAVLSAQMRAEKARARVDRLLR